MLESSNFTCSYWTGTEWANDGCSFGGLDSTHIKCTCNHLTAIAPQFVSPKITQSSTVQPDNKYEKAPDTDEGKITKEDLLVPLDQYFKNL